MRNDIKNALMRDNAETPMRRKNNYELCMPSAQLCLLNIKTK